MAEFKDRIKELRLKKNYSQQRLADILDVNKQTISQYERGIRFPNKENLEALCDAFNVSSDYLLGRDDVSSVLLSGDEMALIDAYRKCPRETQEQKEFQRLFRYWVSLAKPDQDMVCQLLERVSGKGRE